MTEPTKMSLAGTIPPELVPLELKLRKEQIRFETAKAEITELELAERRDQELDRKAKNGFVRRLNITDPIYRVTPRGAEGMVDAWIGALEHWHRRDPGLPIEIVIESPGGDVFAGLSLYDTILRIRRQGTPVTTHGRGMIASMAAVLLQAGSERIIDANAEFMIHEVRGGMGQSMTTSEQAEAAALTKRIENRLLNILADRSTLSTQQIARRWKKTDWYMPSAEALQHGFVDRVE